MSKLNELLKEATFSDDEIKTITECINKSTEWMPKGEWNKTNEEKKALEQQLKDRDNQFKELEKSAGANEELKKQLDTMKKERDNAKSEYEEKIKFFERKSNCICKFAEKCHDPEYVFTKLNLKEIMFNEKNEPTAGLDEQIAKLEENMAYAFKQSDFDNSLISTHKPDGSQPSNYEPEKNDATYVDTYLFPGKK